MAHIRPDRPSGRGGPSLWVFASGLGLLAGGVVIALAVGLGPGTGWFRGPAPTAGAAETAVEPPEGPSEVTGPPSRSETAYPPGSSRTVLRAHPHRGVPEWLVIPALDVNAPVVPIDAPGGVLLPPDDPQTLGWWRDGARPGSRRGSALVTGHTVSSGGGAFDDLETLRRGDTVRVRTATGSIGYEVSRITIYRKASLADHAARVFSQTVRGRLVLVTCEDWNGSTYLSNAVVVAERSS